ncbi:hypothetical protein SDC9_134257 [bioreactor metagenome]|uniref:Uncharacterized protein n=1 Tax=bioreactor metagenome TaxID=1076179 RepID=A0A645DE88_9ZZZZ
MLITPGNSNFSADIQAHGLRHDLTKRLTGRPGNCPFVNMRFQNYPFTLCSHDCTFNNLFRSGNILTAIIHGNRFNLLFGKILFKMSLFLTAFCHCHAECCLSDFFTFCIHN